MKSVNFGDPQLPDRFWSKVTPCPMSGFTAPDRTEES